MPTFTTSSIGTTDPGTETAHYTTIAAWEDATDIDLVTADRQETGKLRNEVFSPILTISGATTDATRYRHLTAYDGEGFRDLADSSTVLRFGIDGARIDTDDTSTTLLVSAEGYFRLTNLQIRNVNTSGGAAAEVLTVTGSAASSTGHLFDHLIVEMSNGSDAAAQRQLGDSSATFTLQNTLIIHRGSGNGFLADRRATINLFNVTIVCPSNDTNTSPAIRFARTPQTANLKNVAVFGFDSLLSDPGITLNITTCATDIASPPTGFTGSLTYADQFENPNASSGTEDFRLKTGADLIGAGTDISGDGVTTDIFGNSRGATYDIGAHEFDAWGGGATIEPGEASSTSSATNPNVVLGSTSVSPARASAASSASVTVLLGGVTVTPAIASSSVSASTTGAVKGSLSLSPARASAASSTSIGEVQAGDSISFTPAEAAMMSSASITIVLGSTSVTPASAIAASSAGILNIVESTEDDGSGPGSGSGSNWFMRPESRRGHKNYGR